MSIDGTGRAGGGRPVRSQRKTHVREDGGLDSDGLDVASERKERDKDDFHTNYYV